MNTTQRPRLNKYKYVVYYRKSRKSYKISLYIYIYIARLFRNHFIKIIYTHGQNKLFSTAQKLGKENAPLRVLCPDFVYLRFFFIEFKKNK